MLEVNRIYCANCLDLMRDIPDKSISLVLTDPPYGINLMHKDGTMGGTSTSVKKWQGQINHKYHPFDDSKAINPAHILRVGKNTIIFGAEYIADKLPISRGWIVWNKRIAGQQNCYADIELAWSSFDKPARVYDHLWMGFLRDSEQEEHYHPTQKPVALGLWILENYSNTGDTILDPYCGSGTFCVAAKLLGRNYIGIEISENYAEIARKRLANTEENLFAQKDKACSK